MNIELRGTKDHPFHFSVGAVVFNQGKVAVIHKQKTQYTLPTETVHLSESLEEALYRGIEEELGVRVEIKKFIGGLVSTFERDGVLVQKTTIYFITEFINQSQKSLQHDEREDEVLWVTPEKALEMLKENNLRGEDQIIDRINY